MSFLEIKELSKIYGATTALDNVTISVDAGTIHGILGENGAGKSTLIKILSGLVKPDSGRIMIDGNSYEPDNIMDARGAGISTAFQELSLLPNLSVAENIFLPNLLAKSGFVVKAKIASEAEKILKEFNLGNMDANAKVESLSLADKQRLEIVRALSRRPRILLLDEPTAALPDPEWLFNLIAQKCQGVLILYISHRLKELRRLCSTGTILRSGKAVETFKFQDVDDSFILNAMLGESRNYNIKPEIKSKSIVAGLEVENLCGEKINNLSFTLGKGEILGVLALEGQGQAELFRMLAGIKKIKNGRVKIDGKEVYLKNPIAAIKSGISYLPEERKIDGIIPLHETLKNMTLSSIDKIAKFGTISQSKEYDRSLPLAKKLALSNDFLNKNIDELSGGNQQKAIIGRVLMTDNKYLVMYDPTRGVDVGTKVTFYEVIKAFSDEGGSALWYSTEIDELISVCHRLLVIYDGKIVANEWNGDLNEQQLLAAGIGNEQMEVGGN